MPYRKIAKISRPQHNLGSGRTKEYSPPTAYHSGLLMFRSWHLSPLCKWEPCGQIFKIQDISFPKIMNPSVQPLIYPLYHYTHRQIVKIIYSYNPDNCIP